MVITGEYYDACVRINSNGYVLYFSDVDKYLKKGRRSVKAGKTTFEEGTRVKIVDSASPFLIGIVGKISHPLCNREDHLASLYDIESELFCNGCQLALTIDEIFAAVE